MPHAPLSSACVQLAPLHDIWCDLLSTTESIHKLASALDSGFIRFFSLISALVCLLQRSLRFRLRD